MLNDITPENFAQMLIWDLEEVLPQGTQAVWSIINEEEGEGHGISFFGNEANAKRMAKWTAKWVEDNLTHLGTERFNPVGVVYEKAKVVVAADKAYAMGYDPVEQRGEYVVDAPAACSVVRMPYRG